MKKFKRKKGSRKGIPEKKKKILTKQTVWGLGIIFLMTASVIGFMWSDGGDVSYGEYQFKQSGNQWTTEINEGVATFYTLPQEVDYINLSSSALGVIKNTRMIYMTFDPDELDLTYIDLVRFDLEDSLPRYFEIFAVSGMTDESDDYDLPIVTCANATQFTPVIYMRSGNKTGISYENGCIIAEASINFNFVRIRDRILYGLFGIIK
jgi:hypothetical protein